MAEAGAAAPAGAGAAAAGGAGEGDGGGAAPAPAAAAAHDAYEPLANLVPLPQPADPRRSNVRFFHQYFQTDPWPAGRFGFQRTLAKAIYGRVESHEDHENQDVLVVVKKIKNEKIDAQRQQAHFLAANGGGGEDIVNEIGILRRLGRPRCDFIVQCLGVFDDATHTYIVMEHAGSEALGCLSAPGVIGQDEQDVLSYTWQLLLAAQYLHSRQIAHCDFSMENVMKAPDERLVLIHFGGAVLCEARDGTPLRHFAAIGKPYYRAPETYIPGQRFQVVPVPRPPGEPGTAAQVDLRQGLGRGYLFEVMCDDSEVWTGPLQEAPLVRLELAGYNARLTDLFAIGVCMFILRYRIPPWASTQIPDKGFRYAATRGIRTLLTSWNQDLMSDEAMALMESLTSVNPTGRMSAREALMQPVMGPARRRNRQILGLQRFDECAEAAGVREAI